MTKVAKALCDGEVDVLSLYGKRNVVLAELGIKLQKVNEGKCTEVKEDTENGKTTKRNKMTKDSEVAEEGGISETGDVTKEHANHNTIGTTTKNEWQPTRSKTEGSKAIEHMASESKSLNGGDEPKTERKPKRKRRRSPCSGMPPQAGVKTEILTTKTEEDAAEAYAETTLEGTAAEFNSGRGSSARDEVESSTWPAPTRMSPPLGTSFMDDMLVFF